MIENFWSVLQIEPTTDKKTIKSAYSSLSKVYHPEDNPEKFMELQKAYKEARAYAKRHKKDVENDLNWMNRNNYDHIEIEKGEFVADSDNSYNNKKFNYENLNYNSEYKNNFNFDDVENILALKRIQEEQRKEREAKQMYIQAENDEIRKRLYAFMESFFELLQHYYTKNNVDAWKYLFQDPRYSKYITHSIFMDRLMYELQGDIDVQKEVWEYWNSILGRGRFSKTGNFLMDKIELSNKVTKKKIPNAYERKFYERHKEKIIEYKNVYSGWADGKIYAKIYLDNIEEIRNLRQAFYMRRKKLRDPIDYIISYKLKLFFKTDYQKAKFIVETKMMIFFILAISTIVGLFCFTMPTAAAELAKEFMELFQDCVEVLEEMVSVISNNF